MDHKLKIFAIWFLEINISHPFEQSSLLKLYPLLTLVAECQNSDTLGSSPFCVGKSVLYIIEWPLVSLASPYG